MIFLTSGRRFDCMRGVVTDSPSWSMFRTQGLESGTNQNRALMVGRCRTCTHAGLSAAGDGKILRATATLNCHEQPVLSSCSCSHAWAGRLTRKTEGLLGQVLIEKFSDLVESFLGFRRSGIGEVLRMRETFEDL